MDRMQRIFKLHQILAGRRYAIPRGQLEAELECSRATLTRILDEMRTFFDAPIEFDKEAGGYRYGRAAFELPGLWFTPSELFALSAAQKLLAEAQPGLLDGQLAPLKARIDRLLGQDHLGGGELAGRLRILRAAARQPDTHVFQTVAGATAQRRRLAIEYHGRERDRVSTREVSPERLVHYRDNWYLDAWCHVRDGLRSFALDRIRVARMLDQAAKELDEAELDRHYGATYGIFAGPARDHAVLRFSAERARWIADERWHPDQEDRWLDDGRFERRLPYADARELVLDILKYGPDVEVVAPAELRAETARRLKAAAAQYD
ncbi:YafY family transcriptional regulator [Parasulfuritortus cantonensis]|uniref:YafY family transcriptional regulator n=1 Tax=Parasulfuritortus cantonensis TaxID=2528202 RepID=A0A4R1BH31_9PROT|nr:YafY family protein [Parasulfuritortus cantonensis]TCJ16501.1 YafY family transcriptional regulator [Parasulfuritortus cantonensis]